MKKSSLEHCIVICDDNVWMIPESYVSESTLLFKTPGFVYIVVVYPGVCSHDAVFI